MNIRESVFYALTAVAMVASTAPASAATALLTAVPTGGTTTTFTTTGNNGFGNPGPVTINGFSVTGNPQVTYGDATYGILSNGRWTAFSWVATNSDGSITFDLGQDYGAVGSFLNYAPGSGTSPSITVLNSSMAVIGTYDIGALAPISTPAGDDAGAFRGISSTDGDIRYFQLSGSFILAHDITVAGTVPEPATWAMMIGGIAAAGGTLRRRARMRVAVA